MQPRRDRAVLEGVPKVAFAPIHDGRWEFTPFPSCLKATCRYMGRDLSYHYLLGASGAAFRLVWHKDRWEGGNVDIVHMSEDPLEPARQAIEAAGARGEFLLRGRAVAGFEAREARERFLEPYASDDEQEFVARIVRSIDAGVPVIAFGVVGPPEACIVTGYDGGGDTLIGWSMFQEHMDPGHDLATTDQDETNPPSGIEDSGYFRRDDWFRRTSGIVTLEFGPPVELDTVYRSALETIPPILRGPSVRAYYTGQAAYDAYIEKLGDDAQYPTSDLPALALRKLAHYDAMTMIAERGEGARFVRDMAARGAFRPARAELESAAEDFQAAGDQMGGWWTVVGSIWDDEEAQVRELARPEVRRAFIPFVEAARDRDAAACRHIEAAIGAL